MAISRFLMIFLMLGFVTACGGSFKPYDYSRDEDARLKKDGYELKLHGRQLRLEKAIELPKYRGSKPGPG
jgi:hypothetical protein